MAQQGAAVVFAKRDAQFAVVPVFDLTDLFPVLAVQFVEPQGGAVFAQVALLIVAVVAVAARSGGEGAAEGCAVDANEALAVGVKEGVNIAVRVRRQEVGVMACAAFQMAFLILFFPSSKCSR